MAVRSGSSWRTASMLSTGSASPSQIYANRHLVENLWARLKEWRAIATRYEKTAKSFMGVLCMAAALDWIKP